jgi:hypothetical protein
MNTIRLLHQLPNLAALAVLAVITACQPAPKAPLAKAIDTQVPQIEGRWLQFNQAAMQDPQPSGLIHRQGQLISISDGSALDEHQQKLHFIDPDTAQVIEQRPILLTESVSQGCFGQYLANQPDYEGLALSTSEPNVIIAVTEDGEHSGKLSQECAEKFEESGAAGYPFLLVRMELEANQALVTQVRPIYFPDALAMSSKANDGPEALTLVGNTLYLGMEEDQSNKPRILKITVDDRFWQTGEFATVEDAGLNLPELDNNDHPINGMDYLAVQDPQHPGYLLAFARNDDELWLIDLAAKQQAKVFPVAFTAPSMQPDNGCPDTHIMDNSSIEGVAVDGETVWLINDPWKRNYLKNIVCQQDTDNYQAMVPLLFSFSTQATWFQSP